MDTTIIYYTANTLREPFASNARKNLLTVKGDLPLISVSQEPMDFGSNILVPKKRSIPNIYRQLLTGAKAAKTKYVATAEDDVLYSKEHFLFQPPRDVFAYDMARWSLYTWTTPPTYSIKYRISLSTMIADRELLIEALEERFAKYPDESKIPLKWWGEPGKYEKYLGVTRRNILQYTSKCPCVVFSHPDALGYEIQGERKALGELRAYDIPHWGKAGELMEAYYYGKK